MKRFTYTPQVKAFINITSGNPDTNPNYGETIDVSEDIISGQVIRNLNRPSSATLTLQNKNGKYLGGYSNNFNDSRSSGYIFTPMDRITISMSRIGEPFQVFSGYLDTVPAFQLYPDSITLRASCTLKRLRYTYFDPGIPFFIQYFAQLGYSYDPTSGVLSDPLGRLGSWGIYGGVSELISRVLQDIGSWSLDNINIVDLPEQFVASIKAAAGNYTTIIADSETTVSTVDPSPAFAKGTSSNNTITNPVPPGETQVSGPQIIAALVAEGMTEAWACAFAGNFFEESGFVTDKVQGGKRSATPVENLGYGLAQWTSDDRQKGLINFANQRGKKVFDFETQIKYVIYEISRSGNGWYQEAKGISNPTENNIKILTEYVFKAYERPEVTLASKGYGPGTQAYNDELLQRQTAALKAYNDYVGNSNPTPPPAATSGNAQANAQQIDSLLTILARQVGVRESPLGSNRGPAQNADGGGVDAYLASTRTPSGNPWCAAFTYWCFQKAGIKECPQTAGAANMFAGLKDKWYASENRLPEPGDLIFYSKSNDANIHHVGIVESVDRSSGKIITVEGNSGWDQRLRESVGVYRHDGKDGNPQPRTLSNKDQHVYAFGRVTTNKAALGSNMAGQVDGTTASTTYGGADIAPTIASSYTTYTYNTIQTSGANSLANGIVQQQLGSTDSTLSNLLTGDHALANDISLKEWIDEFVTSIGRVYCSAPDGSFLSFFPDYFGWFGTTPYFFVNDIEIQDLTIELTDTDSDFATHVYGVGPLIGYTSITPIDNAVSAIASVQEPAFEAFINTSHGMKSVTDTNKIVTPRQIIQDFNDGNWDSTEFLARYGARPRSIPMNNIRNPALLWMATWMEFMKGWAKRYQAKASFTFMPELFPGGRINLGDRVSMFIESVTHNFSYSDGFTTSANLTAVSVEKTTLEGERGRVSDRGRQINPSTNPNTKVSKK